MPRYTGIGIKNVFSGRCCQPPKSWRKWIRSVRLFKIFRKWAAVCSVLAVVACAKETVAHQQSEREANRILVLLRAEGIKAIKMKDEEARELRFNVRVPKNDVAHALFLLDVYNLPEKKRAGLAASFGQGGLIPTAEHEKAKKIVGIEGDLVNTLREIPRVVNAEVAVSLPDMDPLSIEPNQRVRPKASVMLVYLDDESRIPPVSIQSVQRHVQAKLPNLKSEDVNVLLLPSVPAKVRTDVSDVQFISIDKCINREKVLTIKVCAGEGKKIIAGALALVSCAGFMAILAIVSVFRAIHYRKIYLRKV